MAASPFARFLKKIDASYNDVVVSCFTRLKGRHSTIPAAKTSGRKPKYSARSTRHSARMIVGDHDLPLEDIAKQPLK